LRKKIKKIVAIICVVCALSTIFAIPDITVQTVQADAIGVGEFSRIFSSLSGALGSTPKGSGSKFWGNMMDMYGHSFDIWAKTYADMNDKVQSWNNLLLQDVRTFTEYMIKSFPNFMQNLKDGSLDSYVVNDTPSEAKEKFNSFVNSINKTVKLEHQGDINKRYLYYVSKQVAPTLDDSTRWAFDSWRDELVTLENHFSNVDAGYFFQNSIYVGIKTVAFNKDEYGFFYYDNVKKNLVGYSLSGHVYQFDHLTYNGQDQGGYNFYDLPADLQVGNLNNKAGFNHDDIWTNMSFRVFEDGSILLYDPAYLMCKVTFDTINDSLWDKISLPDTRIDDWELADESGKTIDDPTSQILDKIYDNMLTSDDIKALENGDTSVLEKLQGITAVNEKTGETVGNIKEDVNDAVGILGAIKLIGKRIFARQLTLINLVKNLAKGKWTSVIDNVGDLTLPIVKSIDSISQVVSSLSSMKWVIDNVGDICNPIGASIDAMNGNIAGTITNVGNVVKGAIDNIKTVDLTSVIDNVKALPRTIASSLQSAFESVKSAVNSLAVSVGNLFVPTSDSMNSIKVHANTMLLNHFNVDADDLSFNVSENKFKSVKYKNKIIVDAGTMNAGVEFMRPFVQSLCWFFLILFALNQIIQLFDKKGVGDSDS
jgi:hypothetical protein